MTSPQEGLRLTYIGGPTALLSWGGVRLLTDPTYDPAGGEYRTGPVVLTKLAGPAISSEQVGAIDVVLLSHDHHSDNFDNKGREVAASAKHIITTKAGAERLGGKSIGLDAWESFEMQVGGKTLRITATPARHGPAHMDRGPVIGFVLELPDAPGEAIYISGDTVWYEGVTEVAHRFSIRTAVLFMGAARVPAVGPWALTMTAEDGIQVAKAFPQATIVPLHYAGWAHFSESRQVISDRFASAGLARRLFWAEDNAGSPVPVIAAA